MKLILDHIPEKQENRKLIEGVTFGRKPARNLY